MAVPGCLAKGPGSGKKGAANFSEAIKRKELPYNRTRTKEACGLNVVALAQASPLSLLMEKGLWEGFLWRYKHVSIFKCIVVSHS